MRAKKKVIMRREQSKTTITTDRVEQGSVTDNSQKQIA